jgi:hypothetical protein
MVYSIAWVLTENLENRLQYGYWLRKRMISCFKNYSPLDCIEECIRTTRCQSFNYHRGTLLCQINYDNASAAHTMYEETLGWAYGDIKDWRRVILIEVLFEVSYHGIRYHFDIWNSVFKNKNNLET